RRMSARPKLLRMRLGTAIWKHRGCGAERSSAQPSPASRAVRHDQPPRLPRPARLDPDRRAAGDSPDDRNHCAARSAEPDAGGGYEMSAADEWVAMTPEQ